MVDQTCMVREERTPDTDWVGAKPNCRTSKVSCQTERGQLILTRMGEISQKELCLSAGGNPCTGTDDRNQGT